MVDRKALLSQSFRVVSICAALTAFPSYALDRVTFEVAGNDPELSEVLRNASLVLAAERDGVQNNQDLFVAAQGEYSRLLGALYAKGHYSGVIQVLVDGREAASFAPLDPPRSIGRIVLRVDPGPRFTFGKAEVAPLAPGTTLPAGFAPQKPAESGLIQEAATAAVNGWRAVGNAKADVSSQDIVADHNRATLSADLRVAPGPRLRFGALTVVGLERMNLRRLLKIADLPEGEVYDPRELQAAADRLRRTGVFQSVALTEDDGITRPDLLGITANLVEEKTRRYSYGIEIASTEGAKVSGFWLHRNLLGGAERFRIEGSAAQLGAADSGADYRLGITLERPATLSRDTTGTFRFNLARLNEADYTENSGLIGLGFSHYVSEQLTARVGLEYSFSDVTDVGGNTIFRTVSLPVGAIWDTRDSKTDATRGYFLDAEVRPFLGLGTTESGARLSFDARAYRALGGRFVFAGRLQLGSVFNASLAGTPREYLFYSGGGGTVRGQPFQSLGITDPATGVRTGGTSFVALSLEARAKITDKIGIVGFVDAGKIGSQGFLGGDDQSHAGAGVGLRYATGFGPIRLDVATPVSGNTGKGVQVYVGIGQSF